MSAQMSAKPGWGVMLGLGLIFGVAVGCGDDSREDGQGGAGAGEPLPLLLATQSGSLEGFASGSSRVFLGVPFAASPVGALRWRPPAAHAGWSDTLQAFARGPSCPQLSPLDGGFLEATDEDCLTLNVWTPQLASTTPRPVLFWIHGGGYVLGSGGESAYDGQVLSETTGSIVVTINYRLGPLGFLALPELKAEDPAHASSGNYGLEDQRAALLWMRANATAFGGDPSRITLFGESAGGASVCQHMVSPLSADLFAAAVLQSGPCNLVNDETAAFSLGTDLANAASCQGADLLSCMRGKTARELLTVLPSGGFSLSGGGASWYPTIDGKNLPARPQSLLDAGTFHKVPTILGSNADEATLFLQLGNMRIADDAAFLALANELVPGQGSQVLARYPSAEYGSSQQAALAAFTDAGFVCPSRRAARAISNSGTAAYLYSFHYGAPSLFGDLGAFHSAEIKYVFGTPGQLLPSPLTEDETVLSQQMMGYWSRLVSGDPNGSSEPSWPRYEQASDSHLVLDLSISSGSGWRSAQCDYWDTVDTGF